MRLSELKQDLDARFDQVDARFAQVDARLAGVDKRLAAVDRVATPCDRTKRRLVRRKYEPQLQPVGAPSLSGER